MHDPEQVEKVRQAIMRYRELLDLLKARTETAERRYAALFSELDEAQRALPEKLQQREAALRALDDLEPLRRAALRMHFDLRDLERAFEEVYGNIAPEG
jgi:chromosome segregation ATPase